MEPTYRHQQRQCLFGIPFGLSVKRRPQGRGRLAFACEPRWSWSRCQGYLLLLRSTLLPIGTLSCVFLSGIPAAATPSPSVRSRFRTPSLLAGRIPAGWIGRSVTYAHPDDQALPERLQDSLAATLHLLWIIKYMCRERVNEKERREPLLISYREQASKLRVRSTCRFAATTGVP
jgi:hypothetical protein